MGYDGSIVWTLNQRQHRHQDGGLIDHIGSNLSPRGNIELIVCQPKSDGFAYHKKYSCRYNMYIERCRKRTGQTL